MVGLLFLSWIFVVGQVHGGGGGLLCVCVFVGVCFCSGFSLWVRLMVVMEFCGFLVCVFCLVV